MDKLKPILAQKFWILFSLVLIMPLVGYFMTKGKLAAAIDERWKKLDGAFTTIPPGSGVPNESWTAALNVINETQKLHNRHANQALWDKQKALMVWPNDIAPILAKAEYFKDLTEQQKGGQVIFKYPLSYGSQIRALWEIVDPLDEGENLRDTDKRRKVAFQMGDLHISRIANLGSLQPTFREIWEAQEDIWLQTELLNAIRRMNANGISQGDAFVKQLGKIQLFGGAKATVASGETSATGAGTMGGDMAGLMGGGSGYGGQGSEAGGVSIDVNLSEEFDVAQDGGGNAAGASFKSGGSGFTEGSSADPAAAPDGTKRYLDFVEGQPYKRRGFYIKLVMDHRKLPELLAELMHSPFPVEIVRVQQVWLNDSAGPADGTGTMAGGRGAAGGLMGGAGAGGFGAGGAGGGAAGGLMTGGAGPGGGLMTGGAGSGGGGGKSFGSFKPPATGGFGAAGGGAAAGFVEGDGDRGNAGAAARSGLTGSGSSSAMSDPNLAQVAILGVWTLYLPPPPVTDGGQVAPPNSATGSPDLVTSPTPSADTTAGTAPSDSKPATTEPTEAPGEESKKPDDPETPKSEPAKSEKTDSETGKPSTDTNPPKTSAGDPLNPDSK